MDVTNDDFFGKILASLRETVLSCLIISDTHTIFYKFSKFKPRCGIYSKNEAFIKCR